ncbi:hypothetical protein [Nonomuraea sp. WAC 01424]|uniref:hypothetical protein n=1 Tax=Nonomuraea sp. WAC 01424 TaxID=2203200 RepID=UPI00163CB1D3|nr:hypothetical protein [Nonomuraea sp. WAC 01424]
MADEAPRGVPVVLDARVASGLRREMPEVTLGLSEVRCEEAGVTLGSSGVRCEEAGVTVGSSGVRCEEVGAIPRASGVWRKGAVAGALGAW